MSQFKYFGKMVTNKNLIHRDIKRKLNSGNAWYHSVQNLMSLYLLSKNLKIGIYKTIILPVVLYGYGTWSLTIKEEPSIIRMIKSRGMRWVECVAQMGEKRNACRLLVGKPEGRKPLGASRNKWVDNIKMDRDKWRSLMNMVMNFGFYKMLEGSRVAAQPVVSKVMLSSIELIIPLYSLLQCYNVHVFIWLDISRCDQGEIVLVVDCSYNIHSQLLLSLRNNMNYVICTF
jgi:hypothetical protein